MWKELKKLPFDERNEQDFQNLTRRISDAITTIKKSRSIPATQEKLAELASCTRKTLNNRGWPISELKKIKEERKARKLKNTAIEHNVGMEQPISREKMLIGQIRNLQEQNSKLFDRVQELEEQKETLASAAKVLEDEIAAIKDENQKLHGELRKLKQSQNDMTNIVSIKESKKGSTGNK